MHNAACFDELLPISSDNQDEKMTACINNAA
jgi:hypothetical protein